MFRTPLTPFRVACQNTSRPTPFGLTAPIPVTTTLRFMSIFDVPPLRYCVSIGCFYAFRGRERRRIEAQFNDSRGRGRRAGRAVYDGLAGHSVVDPGSIH